MSALKSVAKFEGETFANVFALLQVRFAAIYLISKAFDLQVHQNFKSFVIRCSWVQFYQLNPSKYLGNFLSRISARYQMTDVAILLCIPPNSPQRPSSYIAEYRLL